MVWRRGASLVAANSENGLQLAAVREGVGTNKHLDDETAQTPNISLLGVCGLSHDFGCHPVHTSLEGGAVDMSASATATGAGAEEVRCFDTLRDTKIGDLNTTLVVN